jgi:glycosyltransferase involved in cell wall biosynthesis
VKDCISICKENKKKLHIAGGWNLNFSKHIKYYGMLDTKEKIKVLKKCDALLFPVKWHEPFGIAIIEAMAMGLPVLGSSYGSLPEIINDNVGKIFENYEDLSLFIKNGPYNFNSKEIRSYVEDNFSSSVMADKYLYYYEKVINGENLNKEKPMWSLDNPPEYLRPF